MEARYLAQLISLSLLILPPSSKLGVDNQRVSAFTQALNGAYSNVFQLYQQFFGVAHMCSLVRIVGRTNLPLVVGECLENLSLKVQTSKRTNRGNATLQKTLNEC